MNTVSTVKTQLFILLVSFSISWGAMARQNDHPSAFSWYNQYDVKFYKIDLNASDTSLYIKGNASIMSVSMINRLDTFTFELGRHLTIDSILFNNQRVRFVRSKSLVHIPLPSVIRKGGQMTATVYYQGTVPSNGFFSALSNKTDPTWHIPITWSLSEPYGAKDWFPCKQYLPDKADSAWIFITVPNTCKVGSNGLLKAVSPVGQHRVCYQWKTHYPIAYYLISFTVGDFQDYSYYVRLNARDSMPVQNYIYNRPGYLAKNKTLIDATGEYINYYASLFGDYPFAKEKYGQCLAPLDGGMEHQTMTTLANFEFTLVTHELAHQWFGDWVTCGTWQDIWLNEGFASYGEYLSLDHFVSHQSAENWMEMAHRYAMQDTLGSVYVPEDGVDSEFRIFDYGLTYKKGASIIHQLRYELNNDGLFFAILRQYLKKYAGSVATGLDFQNMVCEMTKEDYSWFFNQWYYGKGFPRYAIRWAQKKDTLFVSSNQSPSAAGIGFFKMHWDLQLNFANSDSLIRLYQDKPDMIFKIPVKYEVEEITADPEKNCLMNVVNISKDTDFMKAEKPDGPFSASGGKTN